MLGAPSRCQPRAASTARSRQAPGVWESNFMSGRDQGYSSPAMQTPSRFVLVLIAITVAWVAGCGGSKARIGKLERGATVLAFGDSLTFGTGAGAGESYPAVLARSTGLNVLNAGVPGETSAEGLERLPDVLEETQPKLLILCHGGNDFLRKMDDSGVASNV